MPQFNLPRKLVATIQMWVSVGLILLAFIFSLMPIITIETPDIAGQLSSMMSDMDIPVDSDVIEMLESDNIQISPLKLVGSIGLVAKLAGAGSDESGETAKELQEYLQTEEGKRDVITAVSIAFSLVNILDSKNMQGSNLIAIVFNVLISVVGFLGTLILTLVVPIILLIKAIGALILVAKGAKAPETVAAKIGAKLPGVISLPLVVMLFQCVVPGMTYGFGVVMICVCAILSVLVNVFASRAREYPEEQFKYLNILQGGALVGIIGFLVFFFNIIKTGILRAFTGGPFAGYLANVSMILAGNKSAAVQKGYIVDAILMVVYLALILGCTSYLDKAARRLSCTVKRERPKGLVGLFFSGKISDNNLISAVLLIATFVIPKVVSGSNNYYINPLSEAAKGDGSFLDKAAFNGDALTGALVGIIIMVVAEVAVIVLKKKFVNLSVEEQEALMLGQAQTSEERLSDAEKIIAEAQAKAEAEAAAVEQTVEEAPAEEAPVEEASDEQTADV